MKYIFILALLASCMFKDGRYVDDNFIEEAGEAALQGYLGVDVDFTPSSPEKKPSTNFIKR